MPPPSSLQQQSSKRVLLSVTDKTGLVEFARFLEQCGFELVATASTSYALENAGLKVTSLQQLTRFPEILGGRVKTLHPAVFGGILARSQHTQDEIDLETHGLQEIAMVVCNLYPFQDAVLKGARGQELIENIDIGGVSLLRAAAKNHDRVTVVCDPSDYPLLQRELDPTTLLFPDSLRTALAVKAFGETAAYDAAIYSVLSQKSEPESRFVLQPGPIQARARSIGESCAGSPVTLSLTPIQALRYGENPHQKAYFYAHAGQSSSASCSLAKLECFHGKELSYNNLLDIEHSVRMAQEFVNETAVALIVKHNTPCGIGIGTTLSEAYERAFEGDPVSPFGGIVTFNGIVDRQCAEKLFETFLEVVVALDYTPEAKDILMRKKNLRLVKLNVKLPLAHTMQYTQVQGGFLAQTYDDLVLDKNTMRIVTQRKPDAREIETLLFAFRIVKHVRSNAIALTNAYQTLAIAGGFTNRIDAVQSCLNKVRLPLQGAVLASDAFFPFPDSIELLKDTGISYIVQPGGSVQDEAVIKACDRNNIGMIFTGIRHFKH